MKNFQSWIVFAVITGLLIAWYMITRSKETFVPQFLDSGNVKRTTETNTSSYAQQTNHFPIDKTLPEGMDGKQTPFRVNMYNAYMQ